MGTQIVTAAAPIARRDVPVPEKFELYTKPRRAAIMAALRGDGDDATKTKSFLSDAARHAGISPKVLYAWLQHGEEYPNGPLGRFNREVKKIQAEHNDEIKQAIWDTAKGSKKWEGFARLGEQYDPETWKRPTEKSSSSISGNIIDKLVVIHADQNALTSGD